MKTTFKTDDEKKIYVMQVQKGKDHLISFYSYDEEGKGEMISDIKALEKKDSNTRMMDKAGIKFSRPTNQEIENYKPSEAKLKGRKKRTR